MAANKTEPSVFEDTTTVRAEHLHHETKILLMGRLYYVAGASLLLAAVTIMVLRQTGEGLRIASFFGMLAAGHAFAAYLLLRLDARARFSASAMALVGLLAIPIGTVLCGYLLYLVHSTKGRRVLSPEYRAVVAKTPEFTCRVTNAAFALGAALVVVAIYQLLRFALRVQLGVGAA
jgi:tellurite resistance protein TehA-like permease